MAGRDGFLKRLPTEALGLAGRAETVLDPALGSVPRRLSGLGLRASGRGGTKDDCDMAARDVRLGVLRGLGVGAAWPADFLSGVPWMVEREFLKVLFEAREFEEMEFSRSLLDPGRLEGREVCLTDSSEL